MADELLTIGGEADGRDTGKDPAVFIRLVLLLEFQRPQYAVEVDDG